MRAIIFVVIITVFYSCKNSVSTELFIDQIIDTISHNSVYKDSIDFDQYRLIAQNDFAETKKKDSVYKVIQKILVQIGDKHSHFYNPKQARKWEKNPKFKKRQNFKTTLIKDNYGYIFLPYFISGNQESNQEYAQKLQDQIYDLDTNYKVKGWIIDLRLNFGGNCWPMLTGLGVITGNDTLGYFLDSNKRKHSIYYKDGMTFVNEKGQLEIKNPKIIDCSDTPVVILVSDKTSSSGELVAILLKSLTNTRILGEKTSGFTTGNETYKFDNGSILFLSTVHFMDYDGTLYIDGLEPDLTYPHYTMNLSDLERDQLIFSAIYWINKHN